MKHRILLAGFWLAVLAGIVGTVWSQSQFVGGTGGNPIQAIGFAYANGGLYTPGNVTVGGSFVVSNGSLVSISVFDTNGTAYAWRAPVFLQSPMTNIEPSLPPTSTNVQVLLVYKDPATGVYLTNIYKDATALIPLLNSNLQTGLGPVGYPQNLGAMATSTYYTNTNSQNVTVNVVVTNTAANADISVYPFQSNGTARVNWSVPMLSVATTNVITLILEQGGYFAISNFLGTANIQTNEVQKWP